jgi:hypothetical protein
MPTLADAIKLKAFTAYPKVFQPGTDMFTRRPPLWIAPRSAAACRFLDYAITNYLVAIVVALTLGQIG